MRKLMKVPSIVTFALPPKDFSFIRNLAMSARSRVSKRPALRRLKEASLSETFTYPHIAVPPGEYARLQKWPQIRVSQLVADYLGLSHSVEEILFSYPHLTPSEIHSALAYYFDHRDEIERELATGMASAFGLGSHATGVSPKSRGRVE